MTCSSALIAELLPITPQFFSLELNQKATNTKLELFWFHQQSNERRHQFFSPCGKFIGVIKMCCVRLRHLIIRYRRFKSYVFQTYSASLNARRNLWLSVASLHLYASSTLSWLLTYNCTTNPRQPARGLVKPNNGENALIHHWLRVRLRRAAAMRAKPRMALHGAAVSRV